MKDADQNYRCVVARCTPSDNCVWMPYPDAISASIKRLTDDTANATVDSAASDIDQDWDGSVETTVGAITDEDNQDFGDQITETTPSTERTYDSDERNRDAEFQDEVESIFDDDIVDGKDYGKGNSPDDSTWSADDPEPQPFDKIPDSAWHSVFNKPLVSIVSCIVILFFIAVIVFLVRYLLGMNERAVYRPLRDQFKTVSYTD